MSLKYFQNQILGKHKKPRELKLSSISPKLPSSTFINKRLKRRSAVFLDRDGTIIQDFGYINSPEKVVLLPTVVEAVSLFNSSGLYVIIISNQSGIGRGLISEKEFTSVNNELWNKLIKYDSYYDAIYYCPHNPEENQDCYCRKPNPGLLLKASEDFCLDLGSCFMIGDKQSDIQTGSQLGIKTILVTTGWGQVTFHNLDKEQIQPNFVASNLYEASKWICSQYLNYR